MADILIVEDEDVIRKALHRLLERNDYSVQEAASVKEAVSNYSLDDFDLIITDLRLPGAPGTDLIQKTDSPVLVMTSYASLRSAVDSMRLGAVDYVAKPFDHDDMLEAVRRNIEAHAGDDKSASSRGRRNRQRGQPQFGEMIGSCKPIATLYDQIRKVGPTEATVLIHGETGTGKELVAKAIHNNSSRAEKPMVSVNCAAIPETLIESELFGYEKGAFTGANTSREGLVEAADGGTLFLDEIGELPMEAQARLLRFIQESEVRRIGATQTRTVDVRLICATHRDLKSMARDHDFREDLYYRISVVRLELPPLRERGKDILELAEAILHRYSEALNKGEMYFSPKAIQAITTYTWPGNVRELENAVERAVILSDGPEIDNDILDIDLELVEVSQIRSQQKPAKPVKESKPSSSDLLDQEDLSLEDYFQRFVLEHQDSMSETELAQKLGVSRKCLWERRQRLGIPRKKNSRTA